MPKTNTKANFRSIRRVAIDGHFLDDVQYASMAGFKSFANAALTIAGIELLIESARDNSRSVVSVGAVIGRESRSG
jgi:hypothetical protein